LLDSRCRLTTLAVISLVALRLGVGWHFFKEGAAKFDGDRFTAKYFLESARGPLAPLYRGMIPDPDGRSRLDRQQTVTRWEAYLDQVKEYYGFDANQDKSAAEALNRHVEQLDWYLDSQREQIDEYLRELSRLAEARAAPSAGDVPYEQQRIAQKETELRGKLNGWLPTLRGLDEGLQRDLAAVATDAERRTGIPGLSDPGALRVDTLVKYLILSVGVCLVLGFLTRPAALAGAAFLISVVLSQPPWVPGTEETYYPTVEALALLVLAATGAGRFAGLDFFWQVLRRPSGDPVHVREARA
jgi:uncharacterized membrane protein YphA (DoxX/SURF4 family)